VVNGKNSPIFSSNRNAQLNALNSIGYMDTVLFLTIGKPDIYQLKSLGKLATVTNNFPNWRQTYLIFSAPATVHLPHYQ
jgi:hypothetical protein